LLWLAWTIALTGICAVCWHRERARRAVLIGVGLAVHSLAPIGLASPLTAAGVLFPATGFWGLLLAVTLCVALAERFGKLAALLSLTAVICQVRFSPPRPIPNWHAVNTSFGGRAFRSMDPAAAFQDLMWISARAKASPGQLLLFPENSLPDYSDAVTGEWLDMPAIAAAGTTIAIGSNRPERHFQHRQNVLLVRGAFSGEYRQRIPIPISMWGRDTDAHLLGPGTVIIGPRHAAILLCYEHCSFCLYSNRSAEGRIFCWPHQTCTGPKESTSMRSKRSASRHGLGSFEYRTCGLLIYEALDLIVRRLRSVGLLGSTMEHVGVCADRPRLRARSHPGRSGRDRPYRIGSQPVGAFGQSARGFGSQIWILVRTHVFASPAKTAKRPSAGRVN
jgi:hypothetical protein